jgi:hypothetical protein
MARDPIQSLTPEQAAARRRGAVRTAWIVAAIALAVYVGSILYAGHGG